MAGPVQGKLRLVAPDGGWGWVVLVAAITVNVLVSGTVKSFGVLFVEFLRVFEATPTDASWVPAICYFLYSSLGPLTSILAMKFSYRSVTFVGGLFAGGGLMLSYFANSMTFLYFSIGIMLGIGVGLCFPVSIYIVSEYFDKYRGLATGLTISGSCIGTIMLPPFLQYLLKEVGHRGAVLIVGGIILNSLGCAMLYHPVEEHMRLVEDPPEIPSELPPMKMIKTEFGDLVSASHRSSIISTVGSVTLDPRRDPRLSIISMSNKLARRRKQRHQTSVDDIPEPEESPRPPLFDLAILKDPLYLVILISNSTSAISNTNFMILLPVYAVSEGFDRDSSALLLSVVSLLDLIGRIGGSSLSDINLMPKHYYFVGGLGLSGVALGLLPMGTSYMYLASFCALFGLASGLYIGTTAVVLADMLGPERLASSYGISLFVNGFMQLIGPPVCNIAYERIGSYKPIFVALGMILICGTSLWSIMPILRRRVNQKAKKIEAENAA